MEDDMICSNLKSTIEKINSENELKETKNYKENMNDIKYDSNVLKSNKFIVN